MRRILFFHECFPAGGAERVTADMARYLTKENFEIHLIASFLKNTIDCIHGCEIPSHYTLKNREAWEYIVNYIISWKIDIFILPITPCYKLLNMVREKTSCKIVYAHHGMPMYETIAYLSDKSRWSKKN